MTLLLELNYAALGPQTVARLVFGLDTPVLDYIYRQYFTYMHKKVLE